MICFIVRFTLIISGDCNSFWFSSIHTVFIPYAWNEIKRIIEKQDRLENKSIQEIENPTLKPFSSEEEKIIEFCSKYYRLDKTKIQPCINKNKERILEEGTK